MAGPAPDWLSVSDEVSDALARGAPIVALESTVIAHGLPRPRNLEVARDLEAEVRHGGATPATVAVLDGVPTIGLDIAALERIGGAGEVEKLSTRDLPLAMAGRWTGATTVAATAHLAARAGVQVFATGGIGGVHRGLPPDVSADLTELQRTRMLVVCAGAKSILDLPATREILETLGVLVIGWGTDRFPAFYTADGGATVDSRVDSAAEVAEIWRAHRRIEAPGSVLLCAPVPPDHGLPAHQVEAAVDGALQRASAEGVGGKALTPFLLASVAEVTGGASLDANVALLHNNVRIAAAVAVALEAK
ncbi:MAG: pseudouridine-5'-phosphate glycosidase [Gemmatimonadota bacterium]